jgi:hypothetical protein
MDAYGNPNKQPNSDTYDHGHGHADKNGYRNRDSDGYTTSDGNDDRLADRYPNSYSNSWQHSDMDAYTVRNADPHANVHDHQYADPDTDLVSAVAVRQYSVDHLHHLWRVHRKYWRAGSGSNHLSNRGR